jgi:hypothetical protein
MPHGDLRGLATPLEQSRTVLPEEFYASTENILASLAAKANAN